MHASIPENDSATVFADDTPVLVKFPLTPRQEKGDRSAWPWLPGWVVSRCGPDEWEICVQVPELARLADGSPAPDGPPKDEAFYPVCFRDPLRSRCPGVPGEPARASQAVGVL